ncbi:MAG: nuclear transport factor 2 family protein [Theionarchaea archaeon]|nr:nuclear transport factor 2 family protein [Theionarchaea archaeon]
MDTLYLPHEEVLTQYIQALEKGDYSDIMALFTQDAVILSPLYGKVRASHFYKELLKDTGKSTITVFHVFTNKNVGAIHFLYEWMLNNGTQTSFECVDIVEFSEDGRIKQLTIIYDTSGIRREFEKMKMK